ncbi:diacylglycerol kinase family protein [Collinsella sp. An2]|uniref:diacylglycerol/lipid kinase family protein n=1 Tax=Collinsella sp. An2 TaxID=1965585 RepID=UPI000B38B46E|nr:diacylglycerol kinase family protein [Collinsella sp. An2]OUP08676.1 diacylglycerol kinase [Collinsella sp. An2]
MSSERNARSPLGRVLIIANPAAHSGDARESAEHLRRFLAEQLPDKASATLVYTERPRHAVELARDAMGFDTVVALGGDGVVHEVVCGLMQRPAADRPTLGVVPVGSGNDYARTLGLPRGAHADISYLLSCERVSMDVGRIDVMDTGATATEYFVETFSIGLDAAIALGTQELRKSSPLSGTALYLASSFSVLGPGYRSFPARIAIDDEAPRACDLIFMAVQIGPTYGSGFRICPQADPTDGLFDTCHAVGPVSRIRAIPVFVRAKMGRHVTSRLVTMGQARRVAFTLGGDDYPIQADGERIHARRLTVSMVPHAISVLRPNNTRL